jgi:hypothetical protein
VTRSRAPAQLLFIGAACACACVAARASAQSGEDPIGGLHRDHQSPQNFAFEVRISSFTPDIDSDPALNGQTPYGTFYGGQHLLVGAEFDWQALRIPHFGTLGPGLALSYTQMGGNATFQKAQANGNNVSGETTTLEILPLTALAVLRVDVFWRDMRIPLVPYAKVGLGYALWRASNTLGTSNANGISGEGYTLGSHFAAGLALNLNPFDEYAAKTFDDAMGVNNTYLYAEWTWQNSRGLGLQSDPLRVGGTYWTFGLTFEF